jgi:chemotaxis family two-component system response regulator Rcp1
MTVPIKVLLIEDNPADVDLVRDSLESRKIHLDLHVATDGEAGMAALQVAGLRPDLILLDLNLPRMSGREVLQEIKTDSRLRAIPVVVLTSSEAEFDIVQTYELGASCYIAKPVDLQSFLTIVERLESFWFTVVKFPPQVTGVP